MAKLNFKGWFKRANFTEEEVYLIEQCDEGDVEIIEETEKAAQFVWHTRHGDITRWIPKSMFQTEEEIEENAKKYMEERKERENRYFNFVEWARKNGVNVRRFMKVKTIVAECDRLGLTVPEEFKVYFSDDAGELVKSKSFKCPENGYPVQLIYDSGDSEVRAVASDEKVSKKLALERDAAIAWAAGILHKVASLDEANNIAEDYGTHF